MLDSHRLKKASDDFGRLSSITARTERTLQSTFSSVQSSLNVAEIQRALAVYNYEGAIAATVTPFHALGDALVNAYIESARGFTETISRAIDQHVTFNPADVRTVGELRNLRALFIADLNATMRESLRRVVVRGLQNNLTPSALLVDMLRAVGLTPRDLDIIDSYGQRVLNGDRSVLLSPVRDRRYDSAVLRGNVAEQQLARMVEAKTRLTRIRSIRRMINTQVQRAVNMGRHGLLQQLVDRDVISSSNVQRTWATVGDPKVRDSHSGMAGQTVGLDEPFRTGHGAHIMYPGDPNAPADEVVNCRCWLLFDVQRS